MSTKSKDVVRRFLTEASQRSASVMDEVFAPAFFNHSPSAGASSDLDGYKQTVSTMLAAFPDFSVTIDDAIAEATR
jgi:predicted ester cyclase